MFIVINLENYYIILISHNSNYKKYFASILSFNNLSFLVIIDYMVKSNFNTIIINNSIADNFVVIDYMVVNMLFVNMIISTY